MQWCIGYEWDSHTSYHIQVISANVFMNEREVGDTSNGYTNSPSYHDC